MLSCGQHTCLRKCHPMQNHTQVKCTQLVKDECPKKHKLSWICSRSRPSSCYACDKEARIAAERQQRDIDLEQKRQALQDAYARKLAAMQVEINDIRQGMKDKREAGERDKVLRQRQKDLEDARVQAAVRDEKAAEVQKQPSQTKRPTGNIPPTTLSSRAAAPNKALATSEVTAGNGMNVSGKSNADVEGVVELPASEARADWEYQKEMEGADNEPLDKLMGMIGLENVKSHFLDIKARIDLAVRQDTDVKKTRFGTALLGNPGTGKKP